MVNSILDNSKDSIPLYLEQILDDDPKRESLYSEYDTLINKNYEELNKLITLNIDLSYFHRLCFYDVKVLSEGLMLMFYDNYH
jgi:hypothetical protein